MRKTVSVSTVCVRVLTLNSTGGLITLVGPQLSGLQDEHDNASHGSGEEGWQMGKNNTVYSCIKHFQLIRLHRYYLIPLIY